MKHFRTAGVSLLELMIVLMIMAIVAALVVPMLAGGVSNTELRSAARQLASGLRLARSEAVTQRRETFLVIDVAGRRFHASKSAQLRTCLLDVRRRPRNDDDGGAQLHKPPGDAAADSPPATGHDRDLATKRPCGRRLLVQRCSSCWVGLQRDDGVTTIESSSPARVAG